MENPVVDNVRRDRCRRLKMLARKRSVTAGTTGKLVRHVVCLAYIASVLVLLPVDAATLTLGAPSYGSCGNVAINGGVTPSSGDTIAQIDWNWGDGSPNTSSYFPSTHKYSQNEIFVVQVTARYQSGDKV